MIILGLETSCDETGLALYDSERGLLAHVLHSQIALHAEYGGVVLELASRDHVRKTLPLLRRLFQQANVAPRQMHELCMAAIEGNARRATALQARLLPLHRQLFCEPSPAPAKWAMSQLGLCGPSVRLPIVPLSEAGQATVRQALRDSGLLG